MNERRTTAALWAVYVLLLGVLLPHTSWAFSQFEQPGTVGEVVAWFGAVAFEFAILALTHRLAGHISQATGSKRALVRWRRRYVNAYAAGLVVAIGVSTLANLAHAVEFGGTLAIFDRYKIPFAVYAVAFGAILPVVSLLFARVLSNVQETEQEQDAALVAAKAEIREIRRQLRDAEQLAGAAEDRAERIEREAAVVRQLFVEDKARRILAAAHLWPGVRQVTIAEIAGASPGYVSDVLREVNGADNGNSPSEEL